MGVCPDVRPPLVLQDVQVVSTDEDQVFLALQEWDQADTYNLYQADPPGVHYSLVLEEVRSSQQPEDQVLIDLLEVRGREKRRDTDRLLQCWRLSLRGSRLG